MIRRILLNSAICGSIALTPLAMAQAPGGGQQQPMPQQQRPSTPDANNPMNNPDTMTRKVDDKKFMMNAAEGGLMEVELGKVAAQNGGSDGVKQFGQRMVDDHSKANDQLKEIMTHEGATAPTSLNSKHQAMVDKLSKLNGEAFDKAYIKNMVKDHEKDVSDFQMEAQNGHDPNLKQFAASTLPTLKEHLQLAKDLKKQGK